MPFEKLRDVVLNDGQTTELAMVVAPELSWRERLCAYLNAPPQPEGPSLHQFLLTHELPELEARYFTMLRDGEVAGCIITTDGAAAGYINSTFVPRPLRQLGIAKNLMTALEDDFGDRGGRVRFLTTRTGSPAEGMFEGFGYQSVWERNGRTGMEKHYEGNTWDSYFDGDPAGARVEEMTWAHWNPHRALMWTRHQAGYHPLDGGFFARMQECQVDSRTRWKALVSPEGKLVGNGVLRPHDRWVEEDGDSYTLDLYVHPGFRAAADILFEAAMPEAGHVQTFLDGDSQAEITFFQERGFGLEVRLKDDFNHHNPSLPDIRVYGKTV